MKKKVLVLLGVIAMLFTSCMYGRRVQAAENEFYYGADISTYLTQVENGAKYYDFEGKELDEQGFFNFLYDNGVNSLRVRVWNNPYDENGNPYGGGNCDLETAKILGQYATNAGMSVLIDFHYSDFWADPSKQFTPKAWENMNLEEKEKALYEYTKESLQYLLDNNVNVKMVQVGNETTTSGMCGETNWKNVCRLFNAGSKAIREVSSDIKVVLHFANPEKKGKYAEFAKSLEANEVDYDVFASSYYPYWHGTLDNLTTILKEISETYDKEVMVAETSWAYTLADGDGSGNTVSESNNSTNMPYTFDVVGQQCEIASVTQAVKSIGEKAIGIYYWENAWTPLPSATWEKGAGWATSYAGAYDPKDAGKYYGGCAVDNQAWFDFTGHPLETVKIYNDIKSGKTFEEGRAEVIEVAAKEVADNLLQNNGFETGKNDPWIKLDDTNGAVTHDDPLSGEYTYHFWASKPFTLGLEQKVKVEPGLYTFGGYLQGSEKQATEKYRIYVIVNDNKYYADITPAGWVVWQNPEITNIPVKDSMEITVGLEGECQSGSWGTFDDFYLVRTGEYSSEYEEQGNFEKLGAKSEKAIETTNETKEEISEKNIEETKADETQNEEKNTKSRAPLIAIDIIAIALGMYVISRKRRKK